MEISVARQMALLVHASIKLHYSLFLVISQTKQKQNTKQRFLYYMNSIFFDSTFDRFSINFIFMFYRYYYFNVYFFNVCLHINRM